MIRRRTMVLTALIVAACDVPTELPSWEQTWVVPGEPIHAAVTDFLPAGVQLTADSSAFRATLEGLHVELRVGDMCETCEALDGATVPKPAFTHTHTTTTTLPSRLLSADLIGEDLDFRLVHQLSFDPLRPASGPDAERGFIVVEVTSEGLVVARDSVSGDDVAFPANSVLTPDLEIASGTVGSAFVVRLTVHSPEGDPVTMDASETIGVQLVEGPVLISEAVVEAEDVTLDGTTTTIELDGVDAAVLDRVQSGALRFDVRDPFGLAGQLVLDFDVAGETIRKTAEITPGESRVDVEFTGTELRRILDAGAFDVTTTGTVSAPDGTITVAPDQSLVLESELELVVLVGGSGGDA